MSSSTTPTSRSCCATRRCTAPSRWPTAPSKATRRAILHDLEVLDSPWDLDPPAAPLRVLILEPDANPWHAEPQFLEVKDKQHGCRLSFSPARPFLLNLRALFQQKDPDLLLTRWGDTWLLPKLLKLSEEHGIPLPLNRDPQGSILYRPERSYFSYGQVIHRGQQMHLAGRWHIDAHNAMMWGDYGLEGVFELARVTGLPMQTTARVSPGTGISAMQMTAGAAERRPDPLAQTAGRGPQERGRACSPPTRAGWSTSRPSGCTATWARSISSPCTPA